MKELNNQITYQCEYCNKRFITKHGCSKHEKFYCRKEESPRVKNCKHENIETTWVTMRGVEVARWSCSRGGR